MQSITGDAFGNEVLPHTDKTDGNSHEVRIMCQVEQAGASKITEKGEAMEHPHIKIENEPKFVDHSPHHGFGGYGGDCFGFGGGGGLLLGALLGRGLFNHGDGHHGGHDNCERAVFDASILSKLGTIEGQVPLVGSQVKTDIAASTGLINTNALQVALSQSQQATTLALGAQAQIAGVKDAVQTTAYATAIAIRDDGDKTRALIQQNETAALNRQLGVLETTLLLERQRNGHQADTHSLVIQNTNTANALQQQQQAQGFQLSRVVDALHSCDQNIRATNQAINIGSGAQVATPNNTSTNNRVN
ncbi:hypothetical protein [Klebsiella aerogenes]|uniref:hypothetical protein n=1 Tax=Klebsiella aerogenes TaxID=548 RepID=UPI00351D1067